MKKVLSVVLVAVMSISLMACGGSKGSKTDESGNNEDKVNQAEDSGDSSASEEHFSWRDNVIVGLSEEGAKQTSIVVPERCEALDGAVFSSLENSIEEVSFASDKDIILGGAFSSSTTLKKVTLPAELTAIGAMDFMNSTALESIVIPEKVETIGELAFSMCSALTKVEMGDSVKSIGKRAFEDCKALAEITLSDNIETIDNNAFFHCDSLVSITLPKNVKTIGENVLEGKELKDIYIPEEMKVETVSESAFLSLGALNIHVKKGSYMDENYDKYFSEQTNKIVE